MGRRARAAHRRLRTLRAAPLTLLRQRPHAAVALAAAALFTLVALLSATGVLSSLDQHAVNEWMPGLDHGAGSRGGGLIGGAASSEALIPGWQAPRAGGERASLATYVVVVLASGLPSVLLAGGALALLARRGRRSLAVCLGAAFVLANVAEVVTKLALGREALHTWVPPGALPRILPFDHSFPSGHTLRSALLAACVLALWRRAGLAVAAWALAVALLLVSGGWHTPTDVIGGVLLAVAFGAAAAAAAPEVEARGPAWLRDRAGGTDPA